MERDEAWRKLLEDAGIDPEIIPDGQWSVEDDPQNQIGGKEKYNISYGTIAFDLRINQERALLEWDAKLPDYMLPGMGRESYTEFLNLLMARIPSRLFQTRMTEKDSKNRYSQASSIELIYDDERKVYELYNEEKKLDFALSFIKPEQKIGKLIFNGSPSRSFAPVYKLGIDYGSDFSSPSLFLSTHMEYNGEKAWNPDTLSWVLGTHRNARFLEDDKNFTDQLSNTIRTKISNSFSAYMSTLPQKYF